MPHPSIEGASSSRLRLLRSASDVTRWVRAMQLWFARIAISLVSLGFCTAAAAQWRLTEAVESSTKASSRVAIVVGRGGQSFSLFRTSDGSVWARFAIADRSLDELSPQRLPIYAIDRNALNDLQALKRLKEHSPWAPTFFTWEPRSVTFQIWHGDIAKGRGEILNQLMSGSSLSFRYCLASGKSDGVSFSLEGAASAIAAALEIPPTADPASAAAMTKPQPFPFPADVRAKLDESAKRNLLDAFHTCPKSTKQ